jgi:hypothetical protein
MKTTTKAIFTTLAVAVPAFLSEPHGPFGAFWAPSPMMAAPTGVQVPLFMLLGIAEALAFGVGVAFLIFGWGLVRAAPVSTGLARAAFLSISWFLVNWWPHDSLHLHNGPNLSGILRIEYAFHFTLILAAAIAAWFFVKVARAQVATAAFPVGRARAA